MIKQSILHIVLLSVLSIILFFTRIGGTSVYQVAEARNAQCAKEMMQRNDWVVPTFNGELRTDKPVLEYWGMITAYKILGVSPGSARFFSSLLGLGMILLTYFFAAKFLVRKAAFWAAIVLLSSAHFVVQMRLATPDPYLIFFNTLSLYLFVVGWDKIHNEHLTGWKGWRWWCGMYIALGFAILAKGPVGVVLPGLIILLFILFKKSFSLKTIAGFKLEWGILITLLIAVPWYLLVHIRTNGAWTEGFFLEHNVSRFSGAMDGHGGLFLLTFAFVFAGMLPFAAFAGHSLKYAWRKLRQNDLLLLSLVAMTTIIIFYSFSKTKLINYTVPAYPFLAVLTGAFLYEFEVFPSHFRRNKIVYLILIWIAVMIPGAVYFWTQYVPGLHHYSWMAVFFIIFPTGIIMSYYFFNRHKTARSLYWIAGTFMLGVTFAFAYPYPLFDSQTPMEKSKYLFTPHRPVAAWEKMNDAFVYYADQPIPVLKTESELADFLDKHEDALIISIADDQTPLQGRFDIKEIRVDREIFNSHTNYIYEQVAGGDSIQNLKMHFSEEHTFD